MSEDIEFGIIVTIIILLVATLVSLATSFVKDVTTNKEICKKLYINTSDCFKCWTNDIDYTINLIQPLKDTKEVTNEKHR